MLEIDGSHGEGGGQILRTSVALAALTGKSVKIKNIRASRSKPGLAPQHLEAVRCMSSLTDADVSGLTLGSTEITFAPKGIKGGDHEIDIGTAGSIPLLLECVMPAATRAEDVLSLHIRGGTDVRWAPSIDYIRYVFLPAIAKMGYSAEIEVVRRGYYPRGGGLVRAVIHPSGLKGVEFTLPEEIKIGGISHSSRLPEHVALRQAASAKQILSDVGYDASISIETNNYESTGSGITLWCDNIGGCAIGERGKPAEEVGKEAAEFLLGELNSGASVDVHLADQLIPYMALAKGKSGITVRELTVHTKTNIWVVEQFLDVEFDAHENELVKIVKR
ncbi:MAG: RNA 3'-terminal phosphate cyclase [Methanosarcinales archaeon]|nr:MAG: RNA 3'-terminal phosphate cyclase [Methanosarcinales archaeon]